ncbi:acyl-CoA dehydrogenase family protein [Spongiibacter sp. KMU-158]|uniref:Acyl-CoA dehydrogenase family protein n=1 Tax=Spongiibacter pelagi TaxID=2760804 RepID=A0A927C1I4_9GAMM|nr:acyl-CoA dehydrogenase family protein [Spongiibacter pelagi]MBD2858081.1 acyl-CoA dehydrogenase family protein [Spongiibacter pelagi]
MDFTLNQDQEMLKTSVDRYFADCPEDKNPAEMWAEFAELGWLAMPFSEDVGGYGSSIIESCMLTEAMGRNNINSPFLSSTLLAGKLLESAPASDIRESLLSALLAGEQQCSVALFENSYADTLENLNCKAEKTSEGWTLSGRKVLVDNPAANSIIVIAQTGTNADSLNAFVVSADHTDLQKQILALMDETQVQNLAFNEVKLPASACLFPEGGAANALQMVMNESIIALAAEAQGAMDALLKTTVEYTRGRKQFGVAIGSFQALQHRMVDMFTHAEMTRAMILRAQCAVLDKDANLPMIVAALKALVGKKSRQLAEEAVQLHGGMGVSEEMPIGRYLRRIMMIDASFGNADIQRRRYCQLRYDSVA